MTLRELDKKYVIGTYKRYPVVLVRGQGAYVWDDEGNRYLDFLAGIAVNGLGHSHPAVVEAVRNQAEKLIHVSNLYHIEPQARLAELLLPSTV